MTDAARIGDRRTVVSRRELKVELERIVLPQVRGEPAVLKPIVEHAKSAPGNQFGGDLIGKTNARGKIVFL